MHVEDDAAATYKLLAAEFKKRGYTIATHRRETDDQLIVEYRSPRGAVWRTNASQITYPLTASLDAGMLRHKSQSLSYAKAHGVSVPDTLVINEADDVDEATIARMLARHAELVVKPDNSTLSRGLSLGLKDITEVREAVRSAREIKPAVIIQEQVTGEEIRFILLGGKVVAALLRQTPRVVGDGHSTVAELLVAENKIRQQLVFPFITYPQLTTDLIEGAFFTDTKVLQDGEILELSRATMIANGASVYDVLDRIEPSYRETVERLTKDIGRGFMACDVFVQDFTRPQTSDNYSFIEFNTSPVLKLCYGCRDGKMYDVVPPLVDLIDQRLNRG